MTQHQFFSLPFEPSALAPHISAETIEFHHGKHHKAYFDKMMKLLPGSGLENESLEGIVKKAKGPLFNNAAQNWNHIFYWKCLSPKNQEAPEGKLIQAIEKKFGSLNDFKQKFETMAVELFGSGWLWLVKDEIGELDLMQGKNAENPLIVGKMPILTADVWEHAYYIDYRNERAKYLKSLWNLMNWQFAQSCFEKQSIDLERAA
jgi:Fe-Mn family superoxide dismutase